MEGEAKCKFAPFCILFNSAFKIQRFKILHSAFYILHSTFCILHSTFYIQSYSLIST